VLDEKAKAALKLGLFSYPVLQAADILVHRFVTSSQSLPSPPPWTTFLISKKRDKKRATHVPVGEDQRQHLEFSRECATNFNHAFGGGAQLLVPPETILCTLTLSSIILSLPDPPSGPGPFPDILECKKNTAPAKRVMSLQQPDKKMSKSASDPRSRILLTDDADSIRRKVMAALTDSVNSVSYDPERRPGISNLLHLLSLFGDTAGGDRRRRRSPAELSDEMKDAKLKDLKMRVADAVIASLEGVRERYHEFMGRDSGRYLDDVQERGAEQARRSAEETMKLVRSAVGL
jgi:tryptophanyl-tRNA synthetase